MNEFEKYMPQQERGPIESAGRVAGGIFEWIIDQAEKGVQFIWKEIRSLVGTREKQ